MTTHIRITLQRFRDGSVAWHMPVPDNCGISPEVALATTLHSSADTGVAVVAALALAQKLYGDELGDIDFQLRHI